MKIGTRSVLFGAHCFFIHPWFVAWAWWKLYGTTTVYWHHMQSHPNRAKNERCGLMPWYSWVETSIWDWRLWVAFFVHDLGYLGKPNMDGDEGELHPELGQRILESLTSEPKWGRFVRYHSRYLAKKESVAFSPLCLADKLAIALTPAWLYLPMVALTGEADEYMQKAVIFQTSGEAAASGLTINATHRAKWYADVRTYCRSWVAEHKDGSGDRWTPAARVAAAP